MVTQPQVHGIHVFAFDEAVKKFLKMRNAVRKYNRIYCWAMLGYKGLALILSTLLLYYPSRKGGRSASEMNALTCYLYVIAVLQRMIVQLYSLGQVFNTSKKFGRCWKQVIAWRGEVTKRNTAVLKVCSAFGFEVGHFYVITSSTILMFFYVLLSYVIFVYRI